MAFGEAVGTVGDSQQSLEFYQLARSFADKEMAPNMARWDREQELPVETLRRACSLGFGGLYVRSDVGGMELGRLDTSVPLISALLPLSHVSCLSCFRSYSRHYPQAAFRLLLISPSITCVHGWWIGMEVKNSGIAGFRPCVPWTSLHLIVWYA
jgi:hypothetical protein